MSRCAAQSASSLTKAILTLSGWTLSSMTASMISEPSDADEHDITPPAETSTDLMLIIGPPMAGHRDAHYPEFQVDFSAGRDVTSHPWYTYEMEILHGLVRRSGSFDTATLLETTLSIAEGEQLRFLDYEIGTIHLNDARYYTIVVRGEDVRSRLSQFEWPPGPAELNAICAFLGLLEAKQWIRWNVTNVVTVHRDADMHSIQTFHEQCLERIIGDTAVDDPLPIMTLQHFVQRAIRAGFDSAAESSDRLYVLLQTSRRAAVMISEWRNVANHAMSLVQMRHDQAREHLEAQNLPYAGTGWSAFLVDKGAYLSTTNGLTTRRDMVIAVIRAFMIAFAMARMCPDIVEDWRMFATGEPPAGT